MLSNYRQNVGTTSWSARSQADEVFFPHGMDLYTVCLFLAK